MLGSGGLPQPNHEQMQHLVDKSVHPAWADGSLYCLGTTEE